MKNGRRRYLEESAAQWVSIERIFKEEVKIRLWDVFLPFFVI